MPDISRRAVAKGAAWSIPTISVAAAAPAMAASSCAAFKAGQPLPASAFAPGYFAVTNQTFGGAANKVISIGAGVSLTPAAAGCVGAAGVTFALNTSNGGTLALTNGKTYTLSGGTGSAGTGVANAVNSGCNGAGGSTASACNTYISVVLANSTGTSSYNPASARVNYVVTIAGYGTTNITLNVSSFTLNTTHWDGSGITFS